MMFNTFQTFMIFKYNHISGLSFWFCFLVLHLSNNHLGEEENFVDKLVSFEGFHDLSLQTAFDKPIPGWIKHGLSTMDRLLFLELNIDKGKICCLSHLTRTEAAS